MLLLVFFFNLSIWFDLISDPDHTQLRQVKVQKIICWKVELIWPIKERFFFDNACVAPFGCDFYRFLGE